MPDVTWREYSLKWNRPLIFVVAQNRIQKSSIPFHTTHTNKKHTKILISTQNNRRFCRYQNTMSKSSHSTASIVAGSIAAAGVVTAASIWNVFRRRAPYLTNDDLLADTVGDLQVVRKLTPADREGLKEAINASFDCLYTVKEEKSVSSGDTEEESLHSRDDMEASVASFVDYVLHITENYGHIIKAVDNGGNYQGSVCMIPPVSRHIYKAYNLSAMMHAGMLQLHGWRDLFSSRRITDGDSFDDRIKKSNHPVLKDCLHDQWYVLNLGVAPSASGKRLGTRMMQQVFHLAKDSQVIWNISTATATTPVSYMMMHRKGLNAKKIVPSSPSRKRKSRRSRRKKSQFLSQ